MGSVSICERGPSRALNSLLDILIFGVTIFARFQVSSIFAVTIDNRASKMVWTGVTQSPSCNSVWERVMITFNKLAVHASHGFCAILCGLYMGASLEAKASQAKAELEHVRFVDNEKHCLTNILYREGRGELVGFRRLIGMTVIARRDDPDPQWPKSICALAFQANQFSGITTPLKMTVEDQRAWDENTALASEVYDEAWRKQFMPRGWECVRFYKVSDEKLAKMPRKSLQQLGITTKKGLGFFQKLEAVDTRGSHTFYKDPHRCNPLPTT